MSVNEKLSRVSALRALAQQLKGKIPARLSELTNDSGFQTETQVAAMIAAAGHLKRKKVASLDEIDLTASDADQFIYLVPKANATGADKYDEYMVLDNTLEPVGSWDVDLSGYVQAEVGKGLSSNDFSDADKEKLDGLEIATDAEISAMLAEIFDA